jgi:hypothetical protein
LFPLFATGVNDFSGKFTAGRADIKYKKLEMTLMLLSGLSSLILFPLFATGVKFAASVLDQTPVANFSPFCVDNGGAPLLVNISTNF